VYLSTLLLLIRSAQSFRCRRNCQPSNRGGRPAGGQSGRLPSTSRPELPFHNRSESLQGYSIITHKTKPHSPSPAGQPAQTRQPDGMRRPNRKNGCIGVSTPRSFTIGYRLSIRVVYDPEESSLLWTCGPSDAILRVNPLCVHRRPWRVIHSETAVDGTAQAPLARIRL